MPKETLLEVDARRRVSLGALAAHDRYLARREPDGTIILTPAVVMPLTEAARQVDAALDAPETATRRQRPRR